MLLLVNKDRVDSPFFLRFFGEKCRVADIAAGVEQFQKMAMLCFGNFVFAYRTLSRLRTPEALEKALGAYARDPATLTQSFAARANQLLHIDKDRPEPYAARRLSVGRGNRSRQQARGLSS